MRTYYHGTTMECARSILKNGFDNETDTVWNCSDCDKLYVRDENHSNWDNDSNECVFFTVESAQIAAAFKNSQDTSVAVFKFYVANDVAEDYFFEDDSCENMSGCFQIEKSDLVDLIKKGLVRCELYEAKNAYIPYLRVFYLRSFIDSPYMFIGDRLLRQAIELVNTGDCFIEELSCYDSLELVCEYEEVDEIQVLPAFAA